MLRRAVRIVLFVVSLFPGVVVMFLWGYGDRAIRGGLGGTVAVLFLVMLLLASAPLAAILTRGWRLPRDHGNLELGKAVVSTLVVVIMGVLVLIVGLVVELAFRAQPSLAGGRLVAAFWHGLSAAALVASANWPIFIEVDRPDQPASTTGSQ